MTEMREAFFDEWRSNDRQRFAPFSVRNVLSLEEKERESKDVVSVYMGDENGLNVRRRVAVSAHSSQGCWRCVDEVSTIKESKRMVSPMRQEGVARPEHFDAVRHAHPSALEVLL